jgi:exodeoxyribonuclease V alpha subunit
MTAATPERQRPAEQLSGMIERVTFFNEENGFCVLRVRARNHREEVIVVGSFPAVNAGEYLVAEGTWARDKEHGLQFKATSMKTVPPTSAEGIERYLRSGLVKGVGPVLAKKLVAKFGAEVLEVIDKRARDLRFIHNIGLKRQLQIVKGWQDVISAGEAASAVRWCVQNDHEESDSLDCIAIFCLPVALRGDEPGCTGIACCR